MFYKVNIRSMLVHVLIQFKNPPPWEVVMSFWLCLKEYEEKEYKLNQEGYARFNILNPPSWKVVV